MNDLIGKYFRSDLSDAEEQALSDLLKTSDEAALKFGEMAEGKYASYGLPEPDLADLAKTAPYWKGLLAPAAVLMLAGVGAWFWCHSSKCSTEPRSTVAVVAPAPQAEVPVIRPPKVQRMAASASAKASVREQVAAPESPKTDAPLAAPPALEPPPETSVDKQTANNLKVVVSRPTAGSVTVQVVGPDGVVVRHMFEGALAAGRWSFDWDGRLQDGVAAQPGRYKIEVLSDVAVQTREVLIR
jgi:hypothetical protein